MTQQMPWDEFGPEEELPELPYKPPDTSWRAQPGDVNWSNKPPPTDVTWPTEQPDSPRPPRRDDVIPPPALDFPPPDPDQEWDDWLAAALKEAFSEALPGIKQNALEMVKGSFAAAAAGKEVDWEHPTVTATTATGKQLVVADARNRSWRTLIQGLIFDLFAGISYVMRLRVTPTIHTKGEEMQVLPVMAPMSDEGA